MFPVQEFLRQDVNARLVASLSERENALEVTVSRLKGELISKGLLAALGLNETEMEEVIQELGHVDGGDGGDGCSVVALMSDHVCNPMGTIVREGGDKVWIRVVPG